MYKKKVKTINEKSPRNNQANNTEALAPKNRLRFVLPLILMMTILCFPVLWLQKTSPVAAFLS